MKIDSTAKTLTMPRPKTVASVTVLPRSCLAISANPSTLIGSIGSTQGTMLKRMPAMKAKPSAEMTLRVWLESSTNTGGGPALLGVAAPCLTGAVVIDRVVAAGLKSLKSSGDAASVASPLATTLVSTLHGLVSGAKQVLSSQIWYWMVPFNVSGPGLVSSASFTGT